MDLLSNFWQLFVLSAPWLMLGLLLAGLINVYLPANFLNRHLGKEGLWTTVKAALIGAPMPLCSCGVIPAAVGLRRAGASKSATTSFLVSTPETGVDSVSVSYALLGPFMAVIRPLAAVFSAITAGLLVGREGSSEQSVTESSTPKQSACCASTAKATFVESPASCSAVRVQPDEQAVSCCPSQAQPTREKAACCRADAEALAPTKPAQAAAFTKFKQALHFSATKLLSDTALWLMIGLFFAALVQTYVPTSYLSQWGNGILAMTVMVLISIPMYICATASTPIAAGLLLAGVSPGAVLVFMLAGPATNIATLGVVGKELGRRAVAAYLTGVIGVALLFGLITDYLVDEFGFEVTPLGEQHHEVLPPWLEQGSAVILSLLLLRLLWLKFSRSHW
ncbi:SO_0444 family Cu/Zn efflux transporter [Pseudoalteromonas sp. BDTF-M6]|uniref:SO_0444 family Cu/Zn efflux transporter n=1 Tax=Pseudoalteromonas sp. BDTF-M6 TaxID=2796132 RepID=UPI001BAF3BC1|nr:SO_0444 family Cu/Zn efflux transporter [Pseudoalteromonas sp. BDTF-M6]MBS3798260.1 SO_0444 family Cu/Zn efflux transporter [Pseudoalteromonas sp. BDTF-M6]